MKRLTLSPKLALIAISFFLLNSFIALSQVGIGNTNPNADSLLEVGDGTDTQGVLLPRVALTNTTSPAPLSTDVAGMIVYNTATAGDVTPGIYYNDGAIWVRVNPVASDDWKTTGNAGTTAGTNFLGTTDAQALQIRTNNTERMRVLSNGQVSVNDPAPIAGDRFTVVGDNAEYAINGYTTSGTGVYGENTSGTGNGVYGVSANIGLRGYGGLGLVAESPIAAGGLILGQGTATGYYTDSGLTVHGNNGITGRGASATGHGLIAAGNGQNPTSLDGGSGVSALGEVGVFGYTMTSGSTGIIGGSNGSSIVTDGNGSGVAGSGPNLGVFGYCPDGSTDNANRGNAGGRFTLDSDNNPFTLNSRANATLAGFDRIAFNNSSGTGYGNQESYFGGYFSGGSTDIGTPSYAYAGLRYNTSTDGSSGTDFKIVGPGSNSTIFKDHEGTPRIMFSPEAPEILFQDFGTGKLVNGQAYIEIDPMLRAGLHIDNEHPLKVYITLEGECNGVYVSNKSINGFLVKELGGGTSNAPFAWQIVANRADTKDDQGNIQSKHVGLRLPVGPGPLNYETKQLDMKPSEISENTESTLTSEKYSSKKPSSE